MQLSRMILASALVAGFTPGLAAQADAPMPNPPEYPFENQFNLDQETLGKFLFHEEQMSFDNTMSCATCHIHEVGGSDPRGVMGTHPGFDGVFGTEDDVAGSPGVVRQQFGGGFEHEDVFFPSAQVTGRKSPTTINSVYFNDLFWDGRATMSYTDPQTGLVEIPYLGGLESQAVGPPLSDVEMGVVGETWDFIADKIAVVTPGRLMTDLPPEMADFLATYPTYPEMFEAAYGDPAVTSKRIAFAIANYERSLISDETIFDDFLKGNPDAFTPQQESGRQLFIGKANCATCHVPPFLMDNDFHNIGLRPDAEDMGRFDFTGDPGDIGRFKTPNIRNLTLRTPLFHNGSAGTVEDVIEFYNRGGDFDDGNLDAEIFELNLTEQEKADLLVFLTETLIDQRVVNKEFPFTRPTLRSELPSTQEIFGVAGQNGSGIEAKIVAPSPAFPGNDVFALGIDDATALQPAINVYSFGMGDGTPYPDPRYPIALNIDVSQIFLITTHVTDADGVASDVRPLPASPALSGMEFFTQWFIADPAVTETTGVYGTEGTKVTII